MSMQVRHKKPCGLPIATRPTKSLQREPTTICNTCRSSLLGRPRSLWATAQKPFRQILLPGMITLLPRKPLSRLPWRSWPRHRETLLQLLPRPQLKSPLICEEVNSVVRPAGLLIYQISKSTLTVTTAFSGLAMPRMAKTSPNSPILLYPVVA